MFHESRNIPHFPTKVSRDKKKSLKFNHNLKALEQIHIPQQITQPIQYSHHQPYFPFSTKYNSLFKEKRHTTLHQDTNKQSSGRSKDKIFNSILVTETNFIPQQFNTFEDKTNTDKHKKTLLPKIITKKIFSNERKCKSIEYDDVGLITFYPKKKQIN